MLPRTVRYLIFFATNRTPLRGWICVALFLCYKQGAATRLDLCCIIPLLQTGRRSAAGFVWRYSFATNRAPLRGWICGNAISSSHPPIFSPSHLLTLSSSHPPIFSPSHLLTLSSSHPLIFSPSHLLTLSSSHSLIFSPSHLLTLSSSHPLIFSPSHLLTLSSSHPLIFSPSHLLTLSVPFSHSSASSVPFYF
jgi:hypothetical protein